MADSLSGIYSDISSASLAVKFYSMHAFKMTGGSGFTEIKYVT